MKCLSYICLRALQIKYKIREPSDVSVCVCVCLSVSNIAARLKPANTESLLPALSYLYCCLSLSPAHCTDRG